MSLYFAETNDESTIDLFRKRLIYLGLVTRDNPKHVVNFHIGEKFMYGRVNELNMPMVIITPSMLGGLKSFNADLCQQKNFYATAFVVDAFHDLIKQYRYSAYNGKIATGDEFLSELQIYKAFENPNALYNQQIIGYGKALKKIFQQSQTNVANFQEFVEHLTLALERSAYRTPFTQAAFIKSRYCPMTCSGFAIEIADLDPVNDAEKMQKFIESPNWEYFVNICNQFGFMIDQFVPWRIVADIDSEGMNKYASAYGATSTGKILNMMYAPAYKQNYQNFKQILLNLYNEVKREFVQSETCTRWQERGKTTQTGDIVTPTSYTIEELAAAYSDQYFLKLYCKIRFLEEESQFKDFEKSILIDECQDIARSQGTMVAVDYFERIINKPFDYMGSMSYIKKQVLAQMAEEQEEQGIPVSDTNDFSGY
jgi:hypothetical protein